MLLKNRRMEQAACTMTIAEPSLRPPVSGEDRELAVEAGEKKRQKRPNEANKSCFSATSSALLFRRARHSTFSLAG
jgi:hypothetical protein